MIRIFVGCAPNHDDAESQAVLEWTLTKHASEPFEITWMKLSRDPDSPFHGWDTSTWATPFSGFRYAVPALCDYEGRAIYMDSDVIVMADIARLWHRQMWAGVVAKSANRFCVSLWDCSHVELLFLSEIKAGRWPSFSCEQFGPRENWNCLDGERYADLNDPDIKALHYTSMPHQPHLELAVDRLAMHGRRHWFDGPVTPHWRQDVSRLFFDMLAEAAQNGFKAENYCHDPIYGDYQKGSNAGLSAAVPPWGKGS